jgi:small subunit ribosomal protein S19
MTRAKWKAPYIHYSLLDDIIKNTTRTVIRTKSRSSTILQSFIGLVIEVYTGRSYNKVYIEEKMVGHKLGEFSFTRKMGRIHEKKNKKSKTSKK